jgi:hypothetical protein
MAKQSLTRNIDLAIGSVLGEQVSFGRRPGANLSHFSLSVCYGSLVWTRRWQLALITGSDELLLQQHNRFQTTCTNGMANKSGASLRAIEQWTSRCLHEH